MRNNSKPQKGTVIITVLMLIAVATYLAVEMTYRQRIDITRTGTLLALSQSEEYVKSAEALAQYVLEQDLRDDINSNDISDHKDEDWPTKVVKPIGRGLVQGEIIDLQGRFNLNQLLLNSLPAGVASYKDQLTTLLNALGIPSSGASTVSAAVIADRIFDWIDLDSINETSGLETLDYQLLDPPYQAGNRVLVDLSELMLVSGLSRADMDILSEHVSLLPPESTTNINTASDIVLGVTGCLDISVINADRAIGPISDADAATIAVANSRFVDDTACPTGTPVLYGGKSEFFLLKAKSEVDKKTIQMHSILYREAVTNASDVKVKVILRKHLDPFSGV